MKNIVSILLVFLFIYSCNNPSLTNLKGLVYGTTYNIQFYSSTNENFSKVSLGIGSVMTTGESPAFISFSYGALCNKH